MSSSGTPVSSSMQMPVAHVFQALADIIQALEFIPDVDAAGASPEVQTLQCSIAHLVFSMPLPDILILLISLFENTMQYMKLRGEMATWLTAWSMRSTDEEMRVLAFSLRAIRLNALALFRGMEMQLHVATMPLRTELSV